MVNEEAKRCRRCGVGVLSHRKRMTGKCPNPTCQNSPLGKGPIEVGLPHRPTALVRVFDRVEHGGLWWWTELR